MKKKRAIKRNNISSKKLLRKIKINNLLSFGPRGISLPLKSLNVIIGPNGSGKSNLLGAISILQDAPNQIANFTRRGGIQDWLWKGNSHAIASIEVSINHPVNSLPLHHKVEFTEMGQNFRLVHELLINPNPLKSGSTPTFSFEYENGIRNFVIQGVEARALLKEDFPSNESILSQLKDRDRYPDITYLGEMYKKIFQFRDWDFGPNSDLRYATKTDLGNDRLEEPKYTNWRMVLNRLSHEMEAKQDILKNIKQLYDNIEDFSFFIEGATTQVFIHESKLRIPATRLSDGTLRYLCLLIILCDPNPPKLICIEEPELGLHPDIIPGLADLLIEASKRTQLIVTTHSDILIDALSETPESVVVCEKHEGQTTMERLDKTELSKWLKDYRLGQLWTKGQIGGTRW